MNLLKQQYIRTVGETLRMPYDYLSGAGAHRATFAAFALILGLAAAHAPADLRAQSPTVADARAPDSLVTLDVRVSRDSAGRMPVEGAVVRSGNIGAQTDDGGEATLHLVPGAHRVIVTRLGFQPDSIDLTLRAGRDTTITIVLVSRPAELEGVVVSATRGERRVEDTPLRVEVIDEEEIAEKVAMTPGDIAMMLNETSGLRVQATNPSLGGADVRIYGLRGRYSLILADGLPLYGGQSGGLGPLQIPPLDLAHVEVIKGSASALYGSSALGGVINLVSRRPTAESEGTVLVNQTSRDGTDGVLFGAGPISERWGYTVLAGAHRQAQTDLDDDGWTDMPGYERVVLRPRLHFDNGAGRSAFLTGGFTAEDRDGGTLDGGTVPDGNAFHESLRTRRADVGGLVRWVMPDDAAPAGIDALSGSILTMRGSATEQRHDHRFGPVREQDNHRTWFGEAVLAVPDGRATYVGGIAFQQEHFSADQVDGFDYTYDIPAAFVQLDLDPDEWIATSVSARLDAHSEYGTFVNPRVSILLRRPQGVFAGWTTRLSGGTGAFAPTPFTEETEAVGLTPLLPLSGLVAERARSASLDVGGPVLTPFGELEMNATAFGSRISHALQVRNASGVTADGATRLEMINAAAPTRTWGGELLTRLTHSLGDDEDAPALRVTATYTYLRASECDPDADSPGTFLGECTRREVPLTPRHAVGAVASIEQEGQSRIGLEVYYTGRQTLEDDPYRTESRPYLLLGLLAERAFETPAGVARVFLNFENITNVRQTRYDPILRPERGPGGRWTTDAWTELSGFTVNGGVRLGF